VEINPTARTPSLTEGNLMVPRIPKGKVRRAVLLAIVSAVLVIAWTSSAVVFFSDAEWMGISRELERKMR